MDDQPEPLPFKATCQCQRAPEETKLETTAVVCNEVETNSPCSPTLPRMDRGWAAYRVLLAVNVLSAMPFGVIATFGVFNQYFIEQKYALADKAVWIGALSSGIMTLGAPIMVYICTKLAHRPPFASCAVGGWLLCSVALVAAAFCSSIPLLIFTQGVLLGIGALLIGQPSFLIVNTWFVDRRGFAYGLCFAASKLACVGLSFLITYLLANFGTRITFLILAALVGLFPLTGIYYLRERGTTSPFRHAPAATEERFDLMAMPNSSVPCRAYYVQPLFYILFLAVFLQGLGFYLPRFYIATYATDVLGLPEYTTPLLTALGNAVGIISFPLFGILSDTGSVHALVTVTCGACGLATALMWGYASRVSSTSGRIATLAMFMTLFNLAGQGFGALWPRMSLFFRRQSTASSDILTANTSEPKVPEVSQQQHQTQSSKQDQSPLVYAWFDVISGVACLISGPISEVLLNPADQKASHTYGLESPVLHVYGGGPGWQELIIFTTCVMAAAALMGPLGWAVDRYSSRAGARRKPPAVSNTE